LIAPVPLAPAQELAAGAIGLWLAPVAELLAAGADPEAALPQGEREHCRRYRHADTRRRALAVRLLAHRALAWIDSGRAWQIAHCASGQPHLPDSPLAISLAHSGAWVSCAVGRVAALGVDIEAVRPRPRLLAFARRFYSAAEVAWLEALAEAERLAAFHDVWTLREAWLKAQGCGLRDYRRAPCTREVLADRAPGWQWQQIIDAPGYRLALCWRADAGSQAVLRRLAMP
jgi:4'-phosphopantetheinyl transferase